MSDETLTPQERARRARDAEWSQALTRYSGTKNPLDCNDPPVTDPLVIVGYHFVVRLDAAIAAERARAEAAEVALTQSNEYEERAGPTRAQLEAERTRLKDERARTEKLVEAARGIMHWSYDKSQWEYSGDQEAWARFLKALAGESKTPHVCKFCKEP